MTSASLLVFFSLQVLQAVRGFSHPSLVSLSSHLSSPSSATYLHVTSKEILDRARKALGIPEEEAAPMIFDENILKDMQSALLKLELRVQEGPGSLSILESEELGGEINRIIQEMHQNPHKRAPRSSPTNDATITSSSNPMRNAMDSESPYATTYRSDTETSDDDGPAYDGTGGMGQPRGTVNTYTIDGMEGMSPEEYQTALQNSLIDRQQKRRESGVTGNRATWNYLTSLGGNGGGDVNDTTSDKKGNKKYNPF